jgi:thiol:disulfide interchange protein DsbD
MPRSHRPPQLFLLFLLALHPQPSGSRPQAAPDWARAQTVVKPRAYVSLDPVPRGRSFQVAVVAEIQPGYHINAHRVTDSFLIPTTLEAKPPEGVRVRDTIYPPSELRKFAFARQKLAVYTGRVTLRVRLEADAAAPLGERKLPLVLHYQACSNTACLPPVKLPIEVALQVAPAGAQAQRIHREIFGDH